MFPHQTKRQKKHLHSLYGYQIDPYLINVRDCMGIATETLPPFISAH